MSDAAGRTAGTEESGAPVTFVGFLVSLARTAAVHFGDLPDPATGARAADVGAAGRVIDVIEMLGEKTRGNLTPEERQLMEGLLQDLRRRSAEVAGRTPPPSAP